MNEHTWSEEVVLERTAANLSPAEARRFADHLATCEECRSLEESYASLEAAYGALPEEDASAEVAERIRNAAREPLVNRPRPRRRFSRRLLALAAGVLVLSGSWLLGSYLRQPRTPAEWVTRAERQEAGGHRREALDSWIRVVDLDPGGPGAAQALHRSGILGFELGLYDVAIESLARLREDHPDHPGRRAAIELEAEALEIAGRPTEALVAYSRLAGEFPDALQGLEAKLQELRGQVPSASELEALGYLGY